MPYEIPVVFQNGSNYDYPFNIKELANDFDGQFECLGAKTERHKVFSLPIEKKLTNIDKYGNESVLAMSFKIIFIGSARLMATSLSNMVDNQTEINQKIKCKGCDFFS